MSRGPDRRGIGGAKFHRNGRIDRRQLCSRYLIGISVFRVLTYFRYTITASRGGQAPQARSAMASVTSSNLLDEALIQCRDMDANINERLACYAAAVQQMNPEFAAAVDRLVERLAKAEAGSAAPIPGDPMPPFVLPDENGQRISLDMLLDKGPVAVTFHRGHWCPYCRININALARAQNEAAANGGHIVAIVPEIQEFAREMKWESHLDFPILTDPDNGYALSLNLVIWVGAEMERMLSERGRDLPRFQGNDAWMLPIPATFVVGTDGLVKARFVDPDYRKRMDIDEMLAALRGAR
jgi:peroxiredoxin